MHGSSNIKLKKIKLILKIYSILQNAVKSIKICPDMFWSATVTTSVKASVWQAYIHKVPLKFVWPTFSAILSNPTALLPQSHDRVYYVSTPILEPPPLWLLKHIDLRAHDFAHSPNVWRQPRLINVICAWSWKLCGTSPYIRSRIYKLLLRGRPGLAETNKDKF